MPTIEEEYRAKYASPDEKASEQADIDAYFSSPEGAFGVVKRRLEDMTRGNVGSAGRPRVETIDGRPAVFVGGEQVFPTPKQREEYTTRKQTELEQQAEQNPSADLATRAGLGFKIGKSGKANFLAKKYGEDRVFQTNDGRLGYIDKDGKPRMADKRPSLKNLAGLGETIGDVLDLGSDVLRILPGAAAGYAARRSGVGAAGTLGMQAAGDVVGEGLAQGVSAMIPGEENISAEDRLRGVATNVLTGAAPGAAMAGAKGAYRAVGPAPMFERKLQGIVSGGKTAGELRPGVREGMRLEAEVGEPLAASQLADTQTAHGLYNSLRKGPAAEIIKEADAARGTALESYAAKSIRAHVSANVAPEASGRVAGTAWNNHVKDLLKKRQAVSEKMVDAIDQAARGRAVVPLRATMAVKDEIVKKFSATIGTATGKRAVEGISELFSKLEELAKTSPGGVPSIKARDFLNSLSQWSAASKGSEMAIQGLESRAVQRKISTMVANALRTDLDNLAQQSVKAGGDVARGIQDFRRYYAMMSETIAGQDSRLLEHAFKLEGKAASDKLARMVARGTYTPDEIRKAMSVLGNAAPDAAMDFRAGVLEELMMRTTRGRQFSPESFAKSLGDRKNQETVVALMEGSGDARAFFSELRNAYAYAQRISKAGTTAGGSPTAPLQEMNRLLSGIPLAGPIAERVKVVLVRLSDPKNLAKAMNTKEGRDLLLRMVKPGAGGGGEGAARAAVQLGELIGIGYMDEDVNLPRIAQ